MKPRPHIDWQAALSRLREAGERLERGAISAGDRARTFRRRAELLATPAVSTEGSAIVEAIVICLLAGERYGIPVRHVAEVVEGAPLAAVPGAPPQVAGVIQVRGEIRCVMDLGILLGTPEPASARAATVLLLSHAGREI